MVRVIEAKLYKLSEGQRKLLRVSGGFELSRVRFMGSRLYCHTLRTHDARVISFSQTYLKINMFKINLQRYPDNN